MKRKAVALLLCVVLLCEVLSPITAMALGPIYTGEELLYEYPRVDLTMLQGQAPTHQMRYVNQFFNQDGTYSAKGRRLLKWLDMSVREDVSDRVNSGYLLLEEEHAFQNGFWQKLGYQYIWVVDQVSATLSSFGVNLMTDFANHQLHKQKFGPAGAYAVPYYDFMCQTYMSYIASLEKEMAMMDEALDVIDGMISPVYQMLENGLTTKENFYVFGADGNTENAALYNVVGFESYKPDGGVRKLTRVMYQVSDGAVKSTTLDEIALELMEGKSVVLSARGLDAVDAGALRSGLDVDLRYVYTTDGIDVVAWSEKVGLEYFDESVNRLLKQAKQGKFTQSEQDAVNALAKCREEGITNPKRPEFEQLGKTLGLVADFTGAAVSWYNASATIRNLNLQQQLYTSVFSQVTEQHLDVLWNWHQTIKKNTGMSKHVRECIDGAIYALICDISESRNNHMDAVIRRNVHLGSYKSLVDATYNTAEFITTLTGVKDILTEAKMMQGSAGSVGGSGIMAAAAVVNFALSMMGSQEYREIREKLTAVYNLKLSFTQYTRELLDHYATNRNHEDAVAIINSLYMVRQLKQAGEDMISMHYLSGLAGEMGLDKMPAAGAILWNEVLNLDSFRKVELDGADYITPVWGVFENSVGKTQEDYIDSAGYSVIRYELVSTPLGYYRRGENATYQGVRLSELPSAFASVDETMWRVVSTSHPAYVQNWHNYVAEKDQSWRVGKLPAYQHIDRVHKEKMYVYQRDGVEVLISVADYEAYQEIADQIAELIETYATPGTDRLDPAKHQDEERLMWANITHGYIESIDMYDPMANYP